MKHRMDELLWLGPTDLTRQAPVCSTVARTPRSSFFRSQMHDHRIRTRCLSHYGSGAIPGLLLPETRLARGFSPGTRRGTIALDRLSPGGSRTVPRIISRG